MKKYFVSLFLFLLDRGSTAEDNQCPKKYVAEVTGSKLAMKESGSSCWCPAFLMKLLVATGTAMRISGGKSLLDPFLVFLYQF
jgi:hypothetical protein